MWQFGMPFTERENVPRLLRNRHTSGPGLRITKLTGKAAA
ncbi:hypothetical protein ANCCAN_08626 [Ancylostoma caninum]|uniref:Uncharacterized protein n=1 Tax=Ancylostoma caninum TaxID=29170 RepID=A0A368GQV4_ANCCA|nr:hypothetical protein ANCCAN_08626 [Ancylostoma caninum]